MTALWHAIYYSSLTIYHFELFAYHCIEEIPVDIYKGHIDGYSPAWCCHCFGTTA
jgi:hypothetical protein